MEMRTRFTESGLPLPWIPPALMPHLSATSDWLCSTRNDEAPTPYDLIWYAKELLSPTPHAPYLVFGHDGHGINSWAIHYYLVMDHVALLLQVAWGNAYESDEESAFVAKTLDSLFAAAPRLWQAAERLRAENALGEDDWLIVIGSDYNGSRWGKWPQGERRIAWHEEDSPLDALLNALDAWHPQSQ